jgi:hypothetical protein
VAVARDVNPARQPVRTEGRLRGYRVLYIAVRQQDEAAHSPRIDAAEITTSPTLSRRYSGVNRTKGDEVSKA